MQLRLSAWFARHGRLAGAAALAAGIALVAAAPASATKLADVRVGTHPGFTRVVLELDGPAGYRLEPPANGGTPELRLELDAEATVKEISAKSPLVRSVRVEPGPRGSVVRIGLASRDIHVTEMILSKPTRIVLDLRQVQDVTVSSQAPRPPGGTGSTSASASAPTQVIGSAAAESAAARARGAAPEPAPEHLEAAAARALGEAPPEKTGGPAGAAAAAVGTAGAAAGEAAAGATEAVAAAADEAASAAAESAAGAGESLAGALAPAGEAAEGAMAAAGEEIAETGEALAEAGAAAGEAAGALTGEARAQAEELSMARGDLVAPEPAPGEAPAPSLQAERAAEAPALPVRRPIEAVPSGGAAGGLPAFLSSPTGIAVVLGAIVLLLFAWLRLRRRPGAIEAIGPSLDEEEGAGLGLGLDAPAVTEETHAAAPTEGAEQEAVSMEEASFPTQAGTEPEPMAPIGGTAAAGMAAAATGAADSRVEELEQRLAHLEKRMEEMVEARERMERQLAAQTEELRVQRAAIARTQRVVRSMARPEDMATEPVPRSPDRPGN